MQLIIGIIVGIIILALLVVVHELGHALVARRYGVVVKEFGIGFPPRAWKKKLKNGVLFTLNWLPLGGFVKLQGEYDDATKPGDYGAAPFAVKTKILLAGVLVNWLVGALLLTILALTGLPKVLPNQFTVPADAVHVTSPVELTYVDADNSPAHTAGLQVGDAILRFDGSAVTSPEALTDATKQAHGKTIEIIYRRGGKEYTTHAQLRDSNDQNKGYLGVSSGQRDTIRSTWSAPIVGVATAGQFTWATLQGLGDMVANFFSGLALQLSPTKATQETGRANLAKAGASVAGPVGILGTIFPAAEQAGPTQLVFLTAVISLTLAVMNVLPIPALDGGRWFLMALFRVLKRPLTREREQKVQAAGFLVLMVIVVLVTITDVGRLVK